MYDTGRRSALPAPMSTGDVGLFSLLTKNIGKDLTRISMPVTLNEPLNTLQVIDVICYFTPHPSQWELKRGASTYVMSIIRIKFMSMVGDNPLIVMNISFNC